MEYKKLYPFVLLILLVGMVLGVGVLVMDKFGTATMNDRTATNDTVAIASAVGKVTYDNLTTLSYFGNQTNNTGSELVLGVDVNFTSDGNLAVHTKIVDGNYNVSYAYKSSSAAYDSLEDTSTELGTIASTWLGLLITIAVLAIILTMVIASFSRR